MITMLENFEYTTLQKLTSEYNVIDSDNYLNTFVNENFPFGLGNIPVEIILLKIIYLKNENDFKMNRLSVFYFANEEDIENMKKILEGAEYEGQPYLIKVKTIKSNIDIEETLKNNLLYQFEYSIILKDSSKVELISKRKL